MAEGSVVLKGVPRVTVPLQDPRDGCPRPQSPSPSADRHGLVTDAQALRGPHGPGLKGTWLRSPHCLAPAALPSWGLQLKSLPGAPSSCPPPAHSGDGFLDPPPAQAPRRPLPADTCQGLLWPGVPPHWGTQSLPRGSVPSPREGPPPLPTAGPRCPAASPTRSKTARTPSRWHKGLLLRPSRG